MKHPFYSSISLLACAYLVTANMRGWTMFPDTANRRALTSTAYRYRPSVFTSGSSSGGWSFGGSHK
ncbi:hypothetical protein SAMN02745166_03903 [Prosthecobacter debontii]|uniref:Uncharacterized protein n=1 Tax=Prosthecobacter debontii TaxID=48467 RepID=A0A1T4YR71_9BACT|nr:hypothetical protein [Prosthecobacter debontii]SKB03751.1 hypothetical protein SAMN02745166_03903 [Prosthecobacter debontii]